MVHARLVIEHCYSPIEREDCIVISSTMCEDQVLQLGAQERERKGEKKREEIRSTS